MKMGETVRKDLRWLEILDGSGVIIQILLKGGFYLGYSVITFPLRFKTRYYYFLMRELHATKRQKPRRCGSAIKHDKVSKRL